MSTSQEQKSMDAITIKNLDVVFGDKPKQARENCSTKVKLARDHR